MITILRIDSSARHEASKTRDLTKAAVESLLGEGEARTEGSVIHRDVSDGLPVVTQTWIGAAYTPEDDRTPEQKSALELSDTLIAEMQEADIIVIGSPVYNFTVPASLKSWFDQVARANVTFEYTDTGPKGLLTGKRAVVLVASGGTEIGSKADFCSPYIEFFLGFLGIEDVDIIGAGALNGPASEKAMKSAMSKIDKLKAT